VSDIRTTHTGSLPRPVDLAAMIVQREEGTEVPGFSERVDQAVGEAVRLQTAVGLDLVNDGEQGKSGYSTYVKERLTGFEGESRGLGGLPELADHPDFAERMGALMAQLHVRTPACTSSVRLRDPEAVGRDVQRLLRAAASAGVEQDRLFMTAASPGVISFFFENHYYADREEYLGALTEAMRQEYRTITDAGIILQLDCPDLAMSRHTIFADSTLQEFRSLISLNVAALNEAVRDIPPERMRMHVCWGNYEGPHTLDVALRDIIDIVLQARPAGLSLEACNPRHGHEWAVFQDVPLPKGKYLIPGVIDSTTNFVENPELVAQRIDRYTAIVGRERVVAGTDCGFGTFVGLSQVVPSVVWAKLRALADGARLAAGREERHSAV
jgi:5-methyltetrahydropteroyltriglutamate--homocysteine methyltransferase